MFDESFSATIGNLGSIRVLDEFRIEARSADKVLLGVFGDEDDAIDVIFEHQKARLNGSTPPSDGPRPMLAAALAYAKRGWAVFPAPPGEKKSCKSAKFSNGVNWGATSDPAQIRKDFRHWPKANIGLPTGADSGIVVFETDTMIAHGVDGEASLRALEEKHGPLPETLMAESPSGSRHRYYRPPDGIVIRNSTSSIGPGIDVRGEGGMVIAPPSVRNDGCYRWLNDHEIAEAPQWLVDAAVAASGNGRTNRTRTTAGRAQPKPGGMFNGKVPAAMAHLDPGHSLGQGISIELPPIEQIRAAFTVIPNDNLDWNKWNNHGMALFRATGGSDDGLAVFHAWSGKSKEKYNAQVTTDRWADYKTCPPTEIGAGSIFHWANEASPNWEPPLTEADDDKDEAALVLDRTADVKFRDLDRYHHPKPSLANAVIAIRALGITARDDLFRNQISVEYNGEAKTIREGLLTDDTISAVRSLINNTFRIDCGDNITFTAIREVARDNAFDPVLDMLDHFQAEWDDTKRLDSWVIDYLGCEDTPLHRAIGRLTLIAACRRARVPGCKYDQITVLEGPEGINKSTAIRVLAGDDYFSDESIIGVPSKEVQEQLGGKWMHENADLDGMRRAEVTKVKTFARRQADRARPAYGRVRVDQPRRSIEWGTTNEDTYMLSQTGNRCFWPLKTGKIDIEALIRDRAQLLGEAAAYEAARTSRA